MCWAADWVAESIPGLPGLHFMPTLSAWLKLSCKQLPRVCADNTDAKRVELNSHFNLIWVFCFTLGCRNGCLFKTWAGKKRKSGDVFLSFWVRVSERRVDRNTLSVGCAPWASRLFFGLCEKWNMMHVKTNMLHFINPEGSPCVLLITGMLWWGSVSFHELTVTGVTVSLLYLPQHSF